MNAEAPGASGATRRARWRELAVLLATGAGVALGCRLGVWQLDRADQKIALQMRLETRARAPVLDEAALARQPDAAAVQFYRRVAVRGRWLAERTVFLDNRQMDGRVGFFVVTPLLLERGGHAVLVQRGWAPRNFTARNVLPVVPTPAGPVSVEGIVAPPPARLFEFSAAASGAIRQNLDIASFARETGLDLLPLSVLQQDSGSAAPDGLVRHWPMPATNVQMHYGYAFQWFALAAGIAILYVWHRFIRPGKS